MTIAGRKGKFEQWLTDDGLTLVEGWARDGLSDEQIAANIGIAGRTYYEWQERFPQFAQAIKKGKAPVDYQVENALFKSATGYTVKVMKPMKLKEEKQKVGEGRIVTERVKYVEEEVYIPPQTAAQVFWLKNRRPDKWRDKPSIEDTTTLDRLDKLLEVAWNAAHTETS